MQVSVFASERAQHGEVTSDSQRPHWALRPPRSVLPPVQRPPRRPRAASCAGAGGGFLSPGFQSAFPKPPPRPERERAWAQSLPGAVEGRAGRGLRWGTFKLRRAHTLTPTHPDTHTRTHTHTSIYIGGGGGGGSGRGGGGERRNDGAEPADLGWKQVSRAQAHPRISVLCACHPTRERCTWRRTKWTDLLGEGWGKGGGQVSGGAPCISGLPQHAFARRLPLLRPGGRAWFPARKGSFQETRKSRPGCAGCLSLSGSWSHSGCVGSGARRPARRRTRTEAALNRRRSCSRPADLTRQWRRSQRILPAFPLRLLGRRRRCPCRQIRRRRRRERLLRRTRRARQGSRRRRPQLERRPRRRPRPCCSCWTCARSAMPRWSAFSGSCRTWPGTRAASSRNSRATSS